MTFVGVAKISVAPRCCSVSLGCMKDEKKTPKKPNYLNCTGEEGSYADDSKTPKLMHKENYKEEGLPQYELPLALSAHMLRSKKKGHAGSSKEQTLPVSTHSPTFSCIISMILLPITHIWIVPPFSEAKQEKQTNFQPLGLFWAPWWACARRTGIPYFLMLIPGAQPEERSMNPFSFLLQLFIWRHLTSILSYHQKLSCISSLRLHPASSCCAISLLPLPHWSRKRKRMGLDRLHWAEKQSRHSGSWKASLKPFSSYFSSVSPPGNYFSSAQSFPNAAPWKEHFFASAIRTV